SVRLRHQDGTVRPRRQRRRRLGRPHSPAFPGAGWSRRARRSVPQLPGPLPSGLHGRTRRVLGVRSRRTRQPLHRHGRRTGAGGSGGVRHLPSRASTGPPGGSGVSRARIRIAGAPITWGVCEVPGWGHQMAPKRVLAEMAELGITATEAGPDGFLPDDPAELAHRLQEHGLKLVGAFIPVVLHDAARWPGEREEAARRIRLIAAAGGEVAVLAAATGTEGYERSADLDDEQWAHLAKAVAELGATA